MTIDLDAYFARIGCDGLREPTLEVLSALHALHPAGIPFENLDALLGRPVSLDLDALQSKLRGGYCFEQNALFRYVLEATGFVITPLIARVVWMATPDQPLAPHNHMLLEVDLAEGPYIADVGFGGQLSSAPLKLEPGLEQTTAEAILRLTAVGDSFVAETLLPAGWTSMCRFTLEPAESSDYELSNWYTSTHPRFLLTTNLLAERLTPAARTSLFNTAHATLPRWARGSGRAVQRRGARQRPGPRVRSHSADGPGFALCEASRGLALTPRGLKSNRAPRRRRGARFSPSRAPQDSQARGGASQHGAVWRGDLGLHLGGAIVLRDHARRRPQRPDRRGLEERAVQLQRHRRQPGRESGHHRRAGGGIEHRRQNAALDRAVAVGELRPGDKFQRRSAALRIEAQQPPAEQDCRGRERRRGQRRSCHVAGTPPTSPGAPIRMAASSPLQRVRSVRICSPPLGCRASTLA